MAAVRRRGADAAAALSDVFCGFDPIVIPKIGGISSGIGMARYPKKRLVKAWSSSCGTEKTARIATVSINVVPRF